MEYCYNNKLIRIKIRRDKMSLTIQQRKKLQEGHKAFECKKNKKIEPVKSDNIFLSIIKKLINKIKLTKYKI